MNNILQNQTVRNLLEDLEKRVNDKVLEPNNLKFLKKLLEKAEDEEEAINICKLGTTYHKTGIIYEKKMELLSDSIKYFKKNNELSFSNGGTTHELIIGDNYYALLNMLVKYRKQVDIIYIDPPYGANSMGEFAKTNYENKIDRDNLLSMLYPRMLLSRMLLSDSGAVFCSIDDKNQAYVKCLFDDIFGESNYITTIPRLTSPQRKGQEDYMNIAHDYILVYSFDENFKKIMSKRIDGKDILRDKNGTYIKGDTKAIFAAQSQGYSTGGDYDFEYNGKIYKPVDKNGNRNRWLWDKERMKKASELGILVETKNTLRMQIYLDTKFCDKTNKMIPNTDNMRFSTVDFMKNNSVSNPNGSTEIEDVLGSKCFAFPKPTYLIEKLVQLHLTNEDAIILDFFAGSGTTGHAVLNLNKIDGNRKFVLVQLPEKINEEETKNQITMNQIELCKNIKRPLLLSEITAERLRRVMTGKSINGRNDFKWLKKNNPLGGSLDVYDIDETSIFDHSIFEKIDETGYGIKKFDNLKDKIEWVCSNFEKVARRLEDAPRN